MKFSIIIATCNRADALRQTLASIEQLRVPVGTEGEILLVDNGSTDETSQVCGRFRHPALAVRILSESRRGKSNALNSAIAAASGDVLLFTDDDVDVPPDWIDSILQHFRGANDAIVGRVKLAKTLERNWMKRDHKWLLAAAVQEESESVILVGANMAIRRKVFQTVPRFDAELGPGALGLGEEFLFGSQMRKAGLSVKLAENCLVTHNPDANRLQYSSWLKAANSCGRSGAYIDYHWEHRTVLAPALKALKTRAKLRVHRLRAGTRRQTDEGCDETEIALVQKIAYFTQMQVEKSRPRVYSQFGFNKLRN